MILGISREESHSGIRSAFRRLVKRYHPDVVGPKWRTQYQDIVEAYQVLSDPERRESYNRGLFQTEARTRGSSEVIQAGCGLDPEPLVPGPVSLLRDFQTSGSPWEALLERFIRNFTGVEAPKAERPEGLTAEIILSPQEALRGGRLPLQVPMIYPCPACDGTGEIWPYRCSRCAGRGAVEEEEIVALRIPAGVRSGTILEVPLQGLGIHNLYLRVLLRVGSY